MAEKYLEDNDTNCFCTEPLFESLCSHRLSEWSRQIPVVPFSPDWEKYILNSISITLRNRHPKCVKKTLEEVRDLYEADMTNFGIMSIVGAGGSNVDDSSTGAVTVRVFNYDYDYNVPRQRNLLASKYFLSHNIMRRIIEIASVKLVRVAVDLDLVIGNDTEKNLFELATLEEKMTAAIARVSAAIKNEYYPEVAKVIAVAIRDDLKPSQGPNSRKSAKKEGDDKRDSRQKIKLLQCATNLFVQQIVRMMIQTIDELTERLDDYRLRCPRLKLHLVWKPGEAHLSIDPPIFRISAMWHSIVRSIETMANELASFEDWIFDNRDEQLATIKVSLPDWYTIEAHGRIDLALTKVTASLKTYFVKTTDEFEAVTSAETRRGIEELISAVKQPEEILNKNVDCRSRVHLLDEQNERASRIAETLDIFDIGSLDQRNAKKRLIHEIAGTRRILVEGMLRCHEQYNEKICKDFEDLRDKLLDIPSSAQELFELSEMIAYPSMSALLKKFESRVTRSVAMLNSLLTLTSDMTEKHTLLNGATINWLEDIKPVIAKSNTLCEAMKSELEDELQRRIARLNLEIEAVLPKFKILDYMDDATRVGEYVDYLRNLLGHLDHLDRKIREINYEERLFKFPETSFSSAKEIREILLPVYTLNNLVREWRRDHAVWLNDPFEYIDPIKVREKTIGYYRDAFEKLNASLRVKIKNDLQQSSSSSGTSASKRLKLYTGIVDDPDPMQQPAPLTLCSHVLEEVKRFEGHLELIDCVCNPSLRERHWCEMSLVYEQSRRASRNHNDPSALVSSSTVVDPSNDQDVSGEPAISVPDAGTTLAKLIRLNLAKDIEKYRVISIGATKELALANRLRGIISRWDDVDFTIVSSADANATKTFANLDEIDALLEHHEIMLREMRVSYFVNPIADDLKKFAESLTNITSVVRAWLRVQNEWQDLQTVFRQKTYHDRLNEARDQFYDVRANAMQIVERRILREPRFRAIVDQSSELSGILARAEETLESVRQTVQNFVQEVRKLFPRFYFVSEHEVIKIVFEPQFRKKQRLLVTKCFTDMNDVKCHPFATANGIVQATNEVCRVTSIVDHCGQQFDLVYRSNDESERDSKCNENFSLVRSFLGLEKALKHTVRDAIFRSFSSLIDRKKLNDEDSTKAQFISTMTDSHIGIAGICSWRLYWTSEMERALEHSDAAFATKILTFSEIEQSKIMQTMLAELRSGEISRTRRRSLAVFIIEVSEQRNVTRLLMKKVSRDGGRIARSDFMWGAQIRHYWREENVEVRILDIKERHGYEYSSHIAKDPVVRTPLTERCWHSLMEAYRNRLYGLVFGSGASGKTRSIEALARTLGVDLRTFDCIQHHFDDYSYMDNVFRGLVERASPSTTSCWLLLKNLDHIAIQGLSMFAQHVTSISSMVGTRCFIVGTINTQERTSSFQCHDSLPDTIKVLFRPISFSYPDAKQIVEVLLFAGGFKTGATLAEKLRLFQVYRSQHRLKPLDWSWDLRNSGMRTTMALVKTACALKCHYPSEAEDTLFLRALVDLHLTEVPSASDFTEFQNTIEDLFPNVALPPAQYEHLASAIRQIIGASMIPDDCDPYGSAILKTIQLFELLLVRHVVVMVGASLAGKTTLINTLACSLSLLSQESNLPVVHAVRINHDSFSSEELFGKYDRTSAGSRKMYHADGLLLRSLRSFASLVNPNVETSKKQWQWILLDGPLYTPLIDELTTLLDENEKTLFVRSNERIHIGHSTTVLFETSSTIGASPATISRCGLVYVAESSTLAWKTRIRHWIVEHQWDNPLVPHFPISSNESCDEKTETFDNEYATYLYSLLEWSLDKCLVFLQKNPFNQQDRLPTNENGLIISVLRLLEMHLTDALTFGDDDDEVTPVAKDSLRISAKDRHYRENEAKKQDHMKKDDRNKAYIANFFTWSQAALLMSIAWGLGGSLTLNARLTFDEFCRSIWRTNADFPHDLINPPSEGLIQDNIYMFVAGTSGTGAWRHSSDLIKKNNAFREGIDYFWSSRANSTSYVPTIDSITYMSLFEKHVKYRKPFVVSGKTATGKTLFMRHLLKTKMAHKRCQSIFYSVARTSSSDNITSSRTVQNLFLSKLKKYNKRVYGPSEQGLLCVNFVDDMSVVATSKEETILRGLIKQFYEKPHPDGCWYNVDNGDRIHLHDVMFIGATDSGANWNRNSRENAEWLEASRFFRHFNLYKIDQPSDDSIYRIYFNVLLANLRSNMFNPDITSSVASIVKATIELYNAILQKFRPTPASLQYRFSPRDLNRAVDGYSLIHKESAETKVTLMRLWVHEMIRTFADRIVNKVDAEWFFVKMKDTAASHFKDQWETVFDNLPKYTSNEGPEHLTRESFRYLLFSDFMRLPDMTDAEVIRGNITSGMVDDNTRQQYRYEEISSSRDALKNRTASYLESYNRRVNEKRKLDILVFPQMLEHLLRICRVLTIPGASLLMICFGASSGRRSLTTLAAFIKSQYFEELSSPVLEAMMTPNGRPCSWREDFKRACMNCFGQSSADGDSVIGATDSRIRDCTFFISDREIIGSARSRGILDDLCSLMKTGKTNDLSFFTTEERDSVVKKCRLLAQRGDRNLEMTSLEVMDYFYSKCQEKLHFILYFDKPGITRQAHRFGTETLEKILNHCTIDCYEDWPDEALCEIGTKFLKNIDIENRVKISIVEASRYFWDSVSLVDGSLKVTKCCDPSVSPCYRKLPVSAYVHTVKLYGLSINKQQNETRASREKYVSGLNKLKSADEEVRKMRSTLTRLRPELELSAKETAETMRKIETENVSVEMATVQVKREEEAANEIAEIASILKEECEADLAVAIPILEDAIAALNTLKPTDITLVKAMKNPPDTVKLVLAAVCVMLGVPPDRSTDPVTGKKSTDYWAPSKRILGDMNFLQNLKDYDKDNIPPSVMSVIIKSYMNDESFMPHIVAKASSAAEGLCKWVRAMVSYDEVAKVVAPKKEKLATAERECNAILEYLNEKRRSLAALNEKLAALKANLQATLAKKLQLENEVADCTGKMKRAEALIASLTGEKARWLEAAQSLTRTCDNLAGDVLLSCGLVGLLSPLSSKQRRVYIQDWRGELDRLGIPNSGEFYEFLGSLRSKRFHGPCDSAGMINDFSHPDHSLSTNSFNQANASILEHSLLWPLILDPQNQATRWIKRVESCNGLMLVKPTNPRWFAQLREFIAKGLPILLENLDRPEYLEKTPAILRYLETTSISSSFRLYITSRTSFNEASMSGRLDEPHDMYKRFNIVNFTLANDALEDRLLEIIVSRERPELRDTFDRLMISSAADKKLLEHEEDQILQVLSSANVNIIEDERALEKLDRWKKVCQEMRMREVETARATEREMTELRKTYRPLTKYCAALYDTLAYLIDFNHMYRFSLDWFIRLYVKSIDGSMKSIILEKRLGYLSSSFTLTLDASVRNALLDEHKLLYSFFLSVRILLGAEKVDRSELRALFLHNATDCKCSKVCCLGRESDDKWAVPEIESDKLMVAYRLSSELPRVFNDLSKSFREDPSSWASYWDDVENQALPTPWNSILTDFQRVILVNRFRPEKTINEVLRLVTNTLGWNSITSTSSTRMHENILKRSYEESSCVVPLIFVLPSYLEAHSLIQKWARTIGHSSSVLRFSMPPSTSSEYAKIENAIVEARKQGRWILLENCHLATDAWLARLEGITESLDNQEDTALSFRLWLTSYPNGNFPISILHNGAKIYCEQPSDHVKQSLLNIYATEPLDDPSFYDIHSGGEQSRAFSKLVYGLCFFHAIVTGRKRYNDFAWNVGAPYEFTDCDLKISIGHLHRVFNCVAPEQTTTFGITGHYLESSLEALIYLVSEVYYGGRILDPHDRLCLRAILLNCCNSGLVRSSTPYMFDTEVASRTDTPYSVPNRSDYRDFVRHIKNCLPSGKAPPRIFGLDDNVAILRDRQSSDHLLHSFAHSFPFIEAKDDEVSTSQGIPCSSRFLNIIIEDIRQKLLDDSSDGGDVCMRLETVRNLYPVCYEEPLNSVLVEQVEFISSIVAAILSSLDSVQRMTQDDEREEVTDSVMKNRVPDNWRRFLGFDIVENVECSSLSRFVNLLCRRRDFLDMWSKTGHYRGSLWLGGLFHCRKIILAARLAFVRKSGVPLNSLGIRYEITRVTTDPEPWNVPPVMPTDIGSDIIHVHGLFLSAARWELEQNSLVECLSKIYWNPMPMIRLLPSRPVRSDQDDELAKNYYSCPVNSAPAASASSSSCFLGSLATNYVTSIPLESKYNAVNFWVKRRTLLFCNK